MAWAAAEFDSTLTVTLHSALGSTLTTPALGRFYKRNGYKGRVQPNDHCLWLCQDDEIIAAARLSPLSPPDHLDGLLLRGFWVAKTRRKQGIGQQLRALLIKHVTAGVTQPGQPSSCALYCFAYPHLCNFYQKQGFQPVKEITSLPATLQRKHQAYAKQPEPPCLMYLKRETTD